ncbi:hypothetical protein JCM10207_006272 [Rhodosporidiobolus poonsookiae]
MPAPTLPRELIDDVLLHLEHDNPHALADLATLCRVSRALMERARRRLYRSLSVFVEVYHKVSPDDGSYVGAETRYSGRSEALVLALFKYPHLPLLTRHLALHCSSGNRYLGTDRHGRHWDAVSEIAASLLSLTPHLESFEPPATACDAVYEAILAFDPPPSIRTLSLQRTTPLAWRMLSRLPELDELHLPHGLYCEGSMPAPQLALKKLDLRYEGGGRGLPPLLTDAIENLTRSSFSTLTHLTLAIDFRSFPPLSHFTSLAHLSIIAPEVRPFNAHCPSGRGIASNLPHCTALRTFTFQPSRQPSSFFVASFCAPDESGLGHNLPTGVTTLRLLSSSFTPDNLLNVIRSLRPGHQLEQFEYIAYVEPFSWGSRQRLGIGGGRQKAAQGDYGELEADPSSPTPLSASLSSATPPPLPFELVHQIFKEARDSATQAVWARVARAFLEPSRRELYKSLIIRLGQHTHEQDVYHYTPSTLATLTSLARHPALGELVQSFVFHVEPYLEGQVVPGVQTVLEDTLGSLLLLCPNVQALALGNVPEHHLAFGLLQAEAKLADWHRPPQTWYHLRLTDLTNEGLELLQRHPEVDELTLFSTRAFPDNELGVPNEPLDLQLHWLDMHFVDHGRLERLFPNITASSSASLIYLHLPLALARLPCLSSFHHLEHLVLSQGPADAVEVVSLPGRLAKLASLCTLELNLAIDSTAARRLCSPTTEGSAANFPVYLENLHLSNSPSTAQEAFLPSLLLDLVRAPSPASLLHLSYFPLSCQRQMAAGDAPRLKEYGELHRVCEEQGIRCTRDGGWQRP